MQRGDAKSTPNHILSAIERADALVVATPVYKAFHVGLVDLIEPKTLSFPA